MSRDPDETLRGDPAQPTDEFERPEPTRRIETEPPRRASQIVLAFVAVAAAGFLIGIAFASLTRQERAGTVVASRAVGPSGGTIRFRGGSLRVPQGAVSETVTIVVRRTTLDERVRVEAQRDQYVTFDAGTLDVYRFEPQDISFRRPVELTFRLPKGARNGTVFAKSDGEIALLTGVLDIDRDTATIEVQDFRFDEAS